MKKRIVSLILALCLLVSVLPVAVFATEGEAAEPCAEVETTLAAPVLTASNIPATGAIHLEWEAVEGAVKYHVYCSQDVRETYALLATVTDTELIHSDAKLHVRYDYYVVAEDAQGNCSEPSDFVGKIRGLAQPVLTIENASNGQIRLVWDPVEGARSYSIYYSYDGEDYRSIGWTVGSDEESVLLDRPATGEVVYYKMKAEGRYVAESGLYAESAFSEPVVYSNKLATPQVTVTTVESTGMIKVSWKPIAGAVQYKVYRSTSGKTGTYSRITTTTKTAVTNTKNMVPGQRYYYKVIALAETASGNSDYSEQQSAVCTLPQPVVTVTYNAAKNGAQISWEPIEGATQYKLYRSTSGKTGTFSRLTTTTKTSVTNAKNFDKAGKYYYKVIAVAENTAGNSAASQAAIYVGKLAQPVVTLSNIASSGKIKVSWQAVEGATGYQVYRATSKTGTYSLLTTTKNTSVSNTSTTAGKTYYYKVMAVADNEAANSDFSEVKSRTCDLPRPVTTAGLNTKGQPKVTWEAVDGAVSYEVYRATTKDGTYKLMKTTTSTSYTNTSITTYETYYYRVVAVASNTAANSAKSVARGITSTSVNISSSKLKKDFVSRVNEYREYMGIEALEWHTDGELTCRTRAAEYCIDFTDERPDGRSVEKMLEAGGVLFELGLLADATAEEVVDTLMYYDDYEDFAVILLYDGWEHAVVACNNGYWCIMLG